jgi:hypothetical protein
MLLYCIYFIAIFLIQFDCIVKQKIRKKQNNDGFDK